MGRNPKQIHSKEKELLIHNKWIHTHYIHTNLKVHMYTHTYSCTSIKVEREGGGGRNLSWLPLKGNVCLFVV